MLHFFYTGVGATEALAAQLDPGFHPTKWGGTYSEVLPYVRAAFARVMAEFSAAVPEEYREKLVGMFRELCDPDPALRRHPRNRRRLETQFGLERYVSELNLLLRRAEAGLAKYKRK
jgi:hypothetical protein